MQKKMYVYIKQITEQTVSIIIEKLRSIKKSQLGNMCSSDIYDTSARVSRRC